MVLQSLCCITIKTNIMLIFSSFYTFVGRNIYFRFKFSWKEKIVINDGWCNVRQTTRDKLVFQVFDCRESFVGCSCWSILLATICTKVFNSKHTQGKGQGPYKFHGLKRKILYANYWDKLLLSSLYFSRWLNSINTKCCFVWPTS